MHDVGYTMSNISWTHPAPGSCLWDAIQLLPNSKVRLKHLVPSLKTRPSSKPKNMEQSYALLWCGGGRGQKLVTVKTRKPSHLLHLLAVALALSFPPPASGPACLHSWGKSRNLLHKMAQSSPCSLLLQITSQQMIFTFLVTNEKPFNSMC